MDIFLKKDVVNDTKLTPEGLAVYIALRQIVKNHENNYYVSANMIAFILTGSCPKRKTVDSVKLGIDNLIDNMKLISVINKINSYEFILDLSSLIFDTSKHHFIIIKDTEVKNIMEYKSKFALLKYFVLLVGTFNNSNILNGCHKFSVGFTAIETMVKNFGIAKSSILSYNNVLLDKELIYIHRFDDYIKTNNGEVKNLQNFYGRFEEREFIKEYAIQYSNAVGSEKCSKKTNKRIANKKNSYLQKYNAMCRGAIYSENDIKELYEFILKYNSEQDKVINMFKNDSSEYAKEQLEKASNKKKDIHEFDKYGLNLNDIDDINGCNNDIFETEVD